MASVKGNMKGFYRQKKNANSNKSSKSSKKSPIPVATSKSFKKSPIPAATFGSDVTQPPALVSHGSNPDLTDEYNENEAMLRQFDMNMTYGPCLGMTRLARWERAQNLGLNPPEEIERLLRKSKVQTECLWNGRI